MVARRPGATPYLVSAIVLVLNIAGASYLYWQADRDDRAALESSIKRVPEQIQERMNTYTTLLRATAGIFNGSNELTEERFVTYVIGLKPHRYYRGLQGLGFSLRFKPSEKAALIRKIRKNHPDFKLEPDTPRDEYHAIIFKYPPTKVLGFDLSTDPARRAGMELARDSGEVRFSPRIDLRVEKRTGFIAFCAVYRPGPAPRSIAERRERLVGYVYTPFIPEYIFARLMATGRKDTFEIYDGGKTDAAHLLFRSDSVHGLGANPIPAAFRDHVIGGRNWRFVYYLAANLSNNRDKQYAAALIVIGLFASALAFYVTLKMVISFQERRSSEERYRQLIEASPDGIYIHTGKDAASSRVVFANRRYAQMLNGGSPASIVGRPVLDHVHPAFRDEARKAIDAILKDAQEIPPTELKHLRLDGSVVDVEVSAVPFNLNGEAGAQVIVRDISARKQLEEQFRQSQKMEAVGRLAGGVAHDFNNILTAILGSAYFLKSDLKAGAPKMEDVDEIVTASHRAAGLTRQLLAFSRRQVLEPKVLSINELVANMEKMIRRLIGEDVELMISLDPAVANVKADPGQLEQVLLNLVVNARDAMPRGGKLTIETAVREFDEAYTEGHRGSSLGRFMMLAISDTGVGMDEATKARIFEPFFTTKEAGKGTGLGLSTVYGIVKQSGGNVWFYSEPGRGTTFKVYLPAVEEPAARAADSIPAKRGDGTETVLVVEDEEQLRSIAVRGLTSLGYKTLQAANGDEAQRIAREPSGKIDLILTDLVMPGLDGVEVAKQLARDLPDAKVIFMSGYTDRAVMRQKIFEEGTPFLQKPFTVDSLGRKVREVLDAA